MPLTLRVKTSLDHNRDVCGVLHARAKNAAQFPVGSRLWLRLERGADTRPASGTAAAGAAGDAVLQRHKATRLGA